MAVYAARTDENKWSQTRIEPQNVRAQPTEVQRRSTNISTKALGNIPSQTNKAAKCEFKASRRSDTVAKTNYAASHIPNNSPPSKPSSPVNDRSIVSECPDFNKLKEERARLKKDMAESDRDVDAFKADGCKILVRDEQGNLKTTDIRGNSSLLTGPILVKMRPPEGEGRGKMSILPDRYDPDGENIFTENGIEYDIVPDLPPEEAAKIISVLQKRKELIALLEENQQLLDLATAMQKAEEAASHIGDVTVIKQKTPEPIDVSRITTLKPQSFVGAVVAKIMLGFLIEYNRIQDRRTEENERKKDEEKAVIDLEVKKNEIKKEGIQAAQEAYREIKK